MSGALVAPEIPELAERPEMESLVDTYGETSQLHLICTCSTTPPPPPPPPRPPPRGARGEGGFGDTLDDI